MAVTWLTPAEVSHTTDDAWTDIDVSGSVPSGATGVILHVETTANVKNDLFGVRKNGSTDARTNSIGGASSGSSHLWIAIGIDGSRIFEAYLDRDNFVNIWLVGYFTDDAVFQTNADVLSIGATGTWTDVDIATETGGDTAIGAFVEIIASADAYDWGVRKNGSGDDRVTGDGNHVWAAIGVDGSEIFEHEISNTGVDCFLVGYVTKEATFHTNGTDETPSGDDAWEDLTALAAGATGGIYEMTSTFGQYTTGLRENGSAETILRITNKHIWGMVEADGSRLIEGYDDFAHSFHEIGYFEAAGGTVYDETGKSQTVNVSLASSDVHAMVETGLAAAINVVLARTDAQTMVESPGQVVNVAQSETDVPVFVETGKLQAVNVEQSGTDSQTMVEGLAQTLVIAQSRSDVQTMVEALNQIVDIVASGTAGLVFDETGAGQVVNVEQSETDVPVFVETGKLQAINVVATGSDQQTAVESILQTVLVAVTGTDAATWIEQQTQAALIAAAGTDAQVMAESLAQQINIALSGTDTLDTGEAVQLLRRLILITDGLYTAR